MSYFLKILFVVLLMLSFAADKPLSAQYDINDHHYGPVEGKSLGLWPPSLYRSYEDLSLYKNKLGYEKLLLFVWGDYPEIMLNLYDDAKNAGFKLSDMLLYVTSEDFEWSLENIAVGNYYLGEPVEHDCLGNPSSSAVSHIYPPEELQEMKDRIKAEYESANFIIDGYKRCSHFTIAGDIADQVMYSSYTTWYEFESLFQCFPDLGWGSNPENAWRVGNDDQSASWYDMENIFESKFEMSWINAKDDEYNELFKAADSIGLNTVFLFASISDLDTNDVRRFSDIAYLNGWLKKVYDIDFFPPYNLQAEEIESGVINISWKDSTNYASGYIIERKIYSDASFSFLDSLESLSISYSDSNVVENQTYNYRIYSYTDERNSLYSDTVTITTSIRSIAAPSDLQAEFQNNLVMISWQDNSDNEEIFVIQRKRIDFDIFSIIGNTEMDIVHYQDSSISENGIYQYRIYAANELAISDYSDTTEVEFILTDVSEFHLDYKLELYQNYPNPFNPSTVIEYSIPVNSELAYSESVSNSTFSESPLPRRGFRGGSIPVKLVVFDVLGRKVATLVNEHKRPGNYKIEFNGDRLPSGIFYYSLNVNGLVTTKKMLLLR